MSNVKNSLALAFKIRPGEGWPTFLLLLISFFGGTALTFLETASYTLFLSKFNVQFLPVVYILSAVVTTGCGLIYSRMEERLSFSRLLLATMVALTVSVSLFYAGFFLPSLEKALALGLLVWHNVTRSLIGLVFWSLASRLLNVRQGKRLFGLIGVGEILAGILAGFSVSFLVEWAGTPSLLLFSAAGMVCCLLDLLVIERKLSHRMAEADDEEEDDNGVPLSALAKDRYFQLIMVTAILSVFAYYILDYVFYDRAEFHYGQQGEEALASFLGQFIGMIGVVNLLGNAFLHSRLMERYGLSMGLLALPVAVLVGSLLAAATGIGGHVYLFFWVVVVTKGLDEFLRVSLEEPSFRILYQPFTPAMRVKSQTITETMVEPGANALIGAILLLLTSVFSLESLGLMMAGVVCLAVWLVVSWLLKREYPNALTRALSKRKLGGAGLALGDMASMEVLLKGLKSSIAGEVINCLNMLEDVEEETVFQDELIRLLDHPDAQVRQHVLEKIGQLKITSAADAIRGRLERETDSKVMGVALRNLCAVAEADAFEMVYTYLDDPHMDLDVKRGAMAGLLSNGGIDGVLSAGSKLNTLLESPKAEERRLAAQVLGEVGIASFYRPLLKLLEDDDLQVRAAAITASGKLKNVRLLPAMIRNFTVPDLNNVVMSAITAFGDSILPELEAVFDREDQVRSLRVKIVRIISRIGGAKAIEILKRKIDFSEEDIRGHVLQALVSCKYQADVQDIPTIQERIRNEAADAAWSLAVLVDVGEHEDVSILIRAIRGETEKNQRRIFALLAMIYPANSILQAQINLTSDSRDRRANAIEVLDNLLPQELKAIVLPLVDEMPASQRLSRLVAQFPQQRMSRHERLKEILARSLQWTSAWSKTCALFVAGRIATKEFHDAIVSCLSDPDAVVRETAVWALGRLNPNDLIQRLSPLKADTNARVAEYARFVINSIGFARIPMGKSGFLTRSGRYTADLFVSVLRDEGERRLRRCHAANILSRFRIPPARAALLEALTISDKMVRTAVLDALRKGEFIVIAQEQGGLRQLLRDEMSDAARIVESIEVFLRARGADRLVQSLRQELTHTRRRILTTLALLAPETASVVDFAGALSPEDDDPGHSTMAPFPDERFTALQYWFIHQDNRVVSEAVTNQLRDLLVKVAESPEMTNRVFDLFHCSDPSRLRERWGLPDAGEGVAVEVHLKKIAFGTDVFSLSWSRICALEMIVRLGMTSCVPRIVEQLTNPDDVMRATSAWALFKLHPAEYARHGDRLKNDVSHLVSRTAKQLNAASGAPLSSGPEA